MFIRTQHPFQMTPYSGIPFPSHTAAKWLVRYFSIGSFLLLAPIKKYYASQNDQEDLISIGTIGLIKAIDSFDSTKGIRLSSYASKCIENPILT